MKIECPRCSGTGIYTGHGVCYRCNGRKVVNAAPPRAPRAPRAIGTDAEEWERLVDRAGMADAIIRVFHDYGDKPGIVELAKAAARRAPARVDLLAANEWR